MRSVALLDALQELRTYENVLQTCEDEVLEAMINMWSEVQVHRTSIFDASVELVEEQQYYGEEQTQAGGVTSIGKPVKLREKRSMLRKQPKSVGITTTQGDLWT